MNWRHSFNISSSLSKLWTSTPTISAHVLNENIFCTIGSESAPNSIQILDIWITGSFSGTGKWPASEEHSISIDNIRNGANLEYSPWIDNGIISSTLHQASIWQLLIGFLFNLNLPASTFTQDIPTTFLSTINLRGKFILDSYVCGSNLKLPIEYPFSKRSLKKDTFFGSYNIILRYSSFSAL